MGFDGTKISLVWFFCSKEYIFKFKALFARYAALFFTELFDFYYLKQIICMFLSNFMVWEVFIVFIEISKRLKTLTAVSSLIFIACETLCVCVRNKTCIVKFVDISGYTNETIFRSKLVLTVMYFWTKNSFSLYFFKLQSCLWVLIGRENAVSFMIKAPLLGK